MKIESKELEHAYQMGKDCALNGANTANCNFRIFSSPEKTKEWERGKRDGEQIIAPKE